MVIILLINDDSNNNIINNNLLFNIKFIKKLSFIFFFVFSVFDLII